MFCFAITMNNDIFWHVQESFNIMEDLILKSFADIFLMLMRSQSFIFVKALVYSDSIDDSSNLIQ